MQHVDEVILEAHFNLEWAKVGRALVVLTLEGDIIREEILSTKVAQTTWTNGCWNQGGGTRLRCKVLSE